MSGQPQVPTVPVTDMTATTTLREYTIPASSQEDFKTPTKPAKRVLSDSGSTLGSGCAAKRRSITIPPSPFLQKLGYGTGVSVFLMNRSNTPTGMHKSPWAVKKLNKKVNIADTSTCNMLEERLLHEAEILKSIQHENIVGYRDTVRGADGSLCLCMESGERSLADLIEQRLEENLGPFPTNNIYQVLHSVSKALSYIHNTKKLLHGDLKSHNILVKGDFAEVKLCDFGVCLQLKDDLQGLANEYDGYVGTGAWSSLEALEDGLITDRADIYSLGCVIFEMLALNAPHLPPLLLDYSHDDSLQDPSFDEGAFLAAQGSIPELPDLNYDKVYHPYIALMTICCRQQADSRPSAQQIVTTLETLSDKALETQGE